MRKCGGIVEMKDIGWAELKEESVLLDFMLPYTPHENGIKNY